MGAKEPNSLCSLVSGRVYKQKWSNPNHPGSNLLVHSSAANSCLAGHTATFTDIISSYKMLNNLK